MNRMSFKWCLAILLSTTTSLLNAQTEPDLAPSELIGAQEMRWNKVSNCGVNALAFVTDYFGAKLDITELADGVDAGKAWERPLSLLELKNFLKSKGLSVSAFKSATLEEVQERLRGSTETIAILHMRSEGMLDGHFLVVAGVSGDGKTLVIEPGSSSDWIAAADLALRYRPAFTGFCLYVASEKRQTDKKPLLLNADEWEFDVEDVPAGQGDYIIQIPFTNPANHAAVIVKARGSCSCFKLARFAAPFEKQVPPGANGTLELLFDRSQFVRGNGSTRTVLLTLGPGEERNLIIRLKGGVKSPDPKASGLLPLIHTT